MKQTLGLLLLAVGCAAPSPRPLPAWEPVVGPPAEARAPREAVGTLTLEGAQRLAEELHPDLEAARARIRAAQGRREQAGRPPNPELVARMESAPFRGRTTGDAEFIGGLRQRIPLGDRLGAAERAEEREEERLVAEFEGRRREVEGRVHGAFASALFARRAVALHEDGIRTAEAGARIARVRRDAGDALPEEVARTEMEELKSRLELDRASSLRDQAAGALAAAIGDAALRIETLDGTLDEVLEIPAIESILKRLWEAPALAAARGEAAAAAARLELEEAKVVPDLNLDLLYRRLEAEDVDAFDVGIGIELPLLDRGQGRVRAAEAEVAAAEARARGARSEAERQVRERHANLVRAVVGARLLKDEILPRSQIVLAGTEARHAGGDLSLADTLPVRREHLAARLAHLEALRDVMEAWAALKPFVQATR